MGYGHGAITKRRKPDPGKGKREYHGPCLNGCGQELHTLGDPPRKFCVACIDKRGEGSRLPEGQTCGKCGHFERCRWLVLCGPMSRTCDWAPSQFRLPEAPAQTEEAATP